MGHFTTASGSTETPFCADSNGNGWCVAADGTFKGIGTTTSHGITIPASSGGLPSPTASAAGIYTDSSANLSASENGGAFSRICTVGNALCNGTSAVVASAEVVSFSTTPTFSTTTNVSRIVLTGNITSFTLAAGSDGQDKKICFKQGAGPFTVVPPANVHGFMTVGTVNAEWSCQAFAYDNTDSIWLATSAGTINQ
jgi:hypothetical protein